MAETKGTTAKVTRSRKIRYANIRYHGGNNLTTPGRPSTEWKENEDNPMSINFVPVEDRNEMAKARWFALYGKKNRRPLAGQFDPS
jgi:hypothetical protein